jgi:hypothetical protein
LYFRSCVLHVQNIHNSNNRGTTSNTNIPNTRKETNIKEKIEVVHKVYYSPRDGSETCGAKMHFPYMTKPAKSTCYSADPK